MRGHQWTATNYQLANLQDGLEFVRRQIAMSAGAKTLPTFRPAPRPDDGHSVSADMRKQDDVRALLESLKPPRLELVREE